jgi:hypothetical protein
MLVHKAYFCTYYARFGSNVINIWKHGLWNLYFPGRYKQIPTVDWRLDTYWIFFTYTIHFYQYTDQYAVLVRAIYTWTYCVRIWTYHLCRCYMHHMIPYYSYMIKFYLTTYWHMHVCAMYTFMYYTQICTHCYVYRLSPFDRCRLNFNYVLMSIFPSDMLYYPHQFEFDFQRTRLLWHHGKSIWKKSISNFKFY